MSLLDAIGEKIIKALEVLERFLNGLDGVVG